MVSNNVRDNNCTVYTATLVRLFQLGLATRSDHTKNDKITYNLPEIGVDRSQHEGAGKERTELQS